MTFGAWYKENEAYLVKSTYSQYTLRFVARFAYKAGEQAGAAALRDERANTLSALCLVADLRAALGDDGKRMQPELIEYARQLAADAARWRGVRSTRHDWIDLVVNDIAELDYNSPEGQPDVMLVKACELRVILETRTDAPELPSPNAADIGGKVQP